MSHITQSNRAMAGFLRARFRGLDFDEVHDPRRRSSCRHSLRTMLMSMVVGIAASCRSLRDVERLTEYGISGPMKRLLGLRRRIPDTTLRDLLCKLRPQTLRPLLHQITRDAYRRKALTPKGLPFGVVALDGKVTATGPVTDDSVFAQHVKRDDQKPQALLRTVTACLVSAAARPVIDVSFVRGCTNEMGHFPKAFDALMDAYGRTRLFELVTYDAGSTSKANAQHIVDAGKHYLLALKTTQPELYRELAQPLAERDDAMAMTIDSVHNQRTEVRRLYLESLPDGMPEWEHLRTVLRVERTVEDQDGVEHVCESRFFLSSLPTDRLTPAQWLLLVRSHWGVENNAHGTLDVQFEEDDHLFVPSHTGASLCVMVLRRVVLSLMVLFRSVSLKSDDKRNMPWRDLLHWVRRALQAATQAQVAGLRPRPRMPLATS